MELFAKLERKQRFTFFNSGSENRFFIARSGLLSSLPMYQDLVRAQKPFDIIRANIIIRSILNKRKFDEVYLTTARQYRRNGELPHDGEIAVRKAIEEAKRGMPYFEMGEERVYIPIFPRSINLIYSRNITRLEEKPLQALLGEGAETLVVDAFDTYGADLFNSYFTNLIKVSEYQGVVAYFDYDSLAIYFVNQQGRLDVNICLFDRQLGKRNMNHMLQRIRPVVDAYFRDDKEELMNTLVQNQLISSSLIYRIKSDETKFFSRLERETNK